MKQQISLRKIPLAAAALALTGFFSVWPGRADATMTEVMGGPGGASFSLNCPGGAFLVGFFAKTGAWVDSVGLLCAPLDATSGKTPAFARDKSTGGTGGSAQEAYCPPGEAMTGVGLAYTRGGGLDRQYVNTIDIFCPSTDMKRDPDRCISSGEGCGHLPPHTAGAVVQVIKDYKYDLLACPAGERATGIQGKSGNFIDAMGLICAALPAAVSTAPPAAKPVIHTGRPKPFDGTFSVGTNLYGSDYRNVALNDNFASTCRDLCQNDAPCKAWTWVKPGVQNPKAMCWLKNSIPAPSEDANTTSGVRVSGDLGVH
jgi:hypothetical protein